MKRHLYWITLPVLVILYIAALVTAETPARLPAGPGQPAATPKSSYPPVLSFWEIETVDEIGDVVR